VPSDFGWDWSWTSLVAGVLAVAVFWDARRIGMRSDGQRFGPVAWAVLVGLLPFCVLGYALRRRQFVTAAYHQETSPSLHASSHHKR
jgi:hypothetical protein